MRATAAQSPRDGIGVAARYILPLTSLYLMVRRFRQAAPTPPVSFMLQPLWTYRLVHHDWTALADAVIYFGLNCWFNGISTFEDVVRQNLPAWLLEERLMELQIFGMISLLAILAGAIVYRGEDAREKPGDLREARLSFIMPPLLAALASSLWLKDIRTIQDVMRLIFPPWLMEERYMEVQCFSMIMLLASLAGIVVVRGDDGPHVKFVARDQPLLKYPLPPVLIPGRTTHTWLSPKKHSSSQPSLSVGIPVGWRGCAGSVLSADVEQLPSSEQCRGWFHVNAKDYLSRDAHECLEHKLRHYLREQGVPDKDWTFAYLVTAPRLLGYSFNPGSFWYIYDSDYQLRMMVLEVDGTFDERRRLHLLKVTEHPKNQSLSAILRDAKGREQPMPRNSVEFSSAWSKDLQVSPFGDKEGSYSLIAMDPLASFIGNGNKDPNIDNVIVLRNRDGEPTVITRIFSTSGPRPASQLSKLELLSFLAQWFRVGVLAMPQILRQASAPYLSKGLASSYGPEILPPSVSRRHTRLESTLERYFRLYIQHLVTSCATRPLRLAYEPPAGMGTKHTFVSKGTTSVDEAEVPDIELKVLSPAFYSRFVHYAHTREALDRMGLATEMKNRTVSVGNAQLLTALLPRSAVSKPRTTEDDDGSESGKRRQNQQAGGSLLETLQWNVLYKLRYPPPWVAHPGSSSSSSSSSQARIADIRALPPSDLDVFVRLHRPAAEQQTYRRAVTKLFLAERYASGLTELVELADLTARVAMIAFAVKTGGNFVAVNALHVWSLVK